MSRKNSRIYVTLKTLSGDEAMRYTLAMLLIVVTGCTVTLVNTSTNGRSSDTVDTEASATADVKPNVQIPAIPL